MYLNTFLLSISNQEIKVDRYPFSVQCICVMGILFYLKIDRS